MHNAYSMYSCTHFGEYVHCYCLCVDFSTLLFASSATMRIMLVLLVAVCLLVFQQINAMPLLSIPGAAQAEGLPSSIMNTPTHRAQTSAPSVRLQLRSILDRERISQRSLAKTVKRYSIWRLVNEPLGKQLRRFATNFFNDLPATTITTTVEPASLAFRVMRYG